MQLFKLFLRSFQSLRLHRLRSLLSTLGILFGVAAVVAMLSIGEGAKKETLEQIEQLGINNIIVKQLDQSEEQRLKATEKRSGGLSQADVEAVLANIPYFNYLAPVKIIEAEMLSAVREITPEILAVNSSFANVQGLQIAEGRFIADRDSKDKSLVCVLGHDVAQALGRNGHLGQTIRIEKQQFRIIGILQGRHFAEGKIASLSSRNTNKCLFIPIGAHGGIDRNLAYKQSTLSEIHLQAASGISLTEASRAIQRLLHVLHRGVEDYQIVIPQELLHQLGRTQRTFNLVLGSIAAVSLLVGGIGIMNIMLATVSERTREIGIRRAVGANKQHIVLQFLGETLLLTLSGACAGVIVGAAFSQAISWLAGWPTIVTFWSVVLSLSMASLIGLCSGLYPALQAARMNPIAALRRE